MSTKPTIRIVSPKGTGGGGSGAWGTITGTITDQTDLVNYVEPELTKLAITGYIAAGTTFSVVASGVNYTKSLDNGNLRTSQVLFEGDNIIRIVVSGVELDKIDEVTWIDSQSFQLTSLAVDNGDVIHVYS